jgi:hypothetical protein
VGRPVPAVTCSSTDCDAATTARGLCKPHYMRAWRTSTLPDLAPRTPYVPDPNPTPQVAAVRAIAGGGDIDTRCRRLLYAFYPVWFGRPFPHRPVTVEAAARWRADREAVRQALADNRTYRRRQAA